MIKTALNKIIPFTLGVVATLSVLSSSNSADNIGLVSSLNYQDASCSNNQYCDSVDYGYQVVEKVGDINGGESDSLEMPEPIDTTNDTVPNVIISTSDSSTEINNTNPVVDTNKVTEISIDTENPDILFKLSPGINLAQAEFAPNDPNFNHSYPTSSIDYYAKSGIKLIRLPFLWERIQPSLSGELSSNELTMLDEFLSKAADNGMYVILDLHNYGRYNGELIGSDNVPSGALVDVWNKISSRYKSNPTVIAYGLMNEPHDMGSSTIWKKTAQEVVDSIRQIDTDTLILVAGDSWSSTWHWQHNNADLIINDPSDRVLYEGHIYFDTNNSGVYDCDYDTCGISDTTISSRLDGYLQWLEDNEVKGFIGEYGTPSSDPRWDKLIDHFLVRLEQKSVGSTIWAGGSMWGDYVLSIEPSYDINGNIVEAPQMRILRNHLNRCVRIDRNGITKDCIIRISPNP